MPKVYKQLPLAGTIAIEVPKKVLKFAKDGSVRLVNTLTKVGGIAKNGGLPNIKLIPVAGVETKVISQGTLKEASKSARKQMGELYEYERKAVIGRLNRPNSVVRNIGRVKHQPSIKDQAATKLQSAFRNHLAKIELTNRQDDAYEERLRQRRALGSGLEVEPMGNMPKQYHTTASIRNVKEGREIAATKLQNAFRNHLATIELVKRQDESYEKKKKKKQAATKLQNAYRGRLARGKLAEKDYERMLVETSAPTTHDYHEYDYNMYNKRA